MRRGSQDKGDDRDTLAIGTMNATTMRRLRWWWLWGWKKHHKTNVMVGTLQQ